MEKPMLSLRGVSLSYHTKEAETEALKDLTFSVEQGEFAAIVGPSGCGKTTVLSLIMGLIEPAAGEVLFPLGQCPMGYMLQRDHLLEWRTVEKNVLLGLEVQKKLTKESREYAPEGGAYSHLSSRPPTAAP